MTAPVALNDGACFDENVALDYLSGALGGGEADALRAHAESCATCRRVLSELGRALTPSNPGAPSAGADVASAAVTAARPGAPVPWAAPPGTSVGRYQVLTPLGAGAMGVVYLAYDPELDRNVALKLLADHVVGAPSPGAAEQATRSRAASLRAEAQAMAKASHPNLVAVYDVGEWGGRVYLTMELVAGSSLGAWLGARRRSWREVLGAFVQAGRGLESAHRAGVVHGDFKPDNVLIDGEGRVKVGDFGLAVFGRGAEGGRPPGGEGPSAGARAKGARVLRGTPAYLAPEQWGGARADARSDQYAFCIALSEALFGSRPRGGSEPAAAVRPPPGPGPARGRVPGRVRAALRRGLSERPEARFASMGALLQELEPRRPGALAFGATAAGAAVAALGLTLALRPAAERPCAHVGARLEGAWGEARRAAVREAMLGAAAAYAPDVWRVVERRLDGYASSWVDARTRACLADRASAGAARAQATCLDEQVLDVDALVRELSTSNPQRLSRAPLAVEGLPSPSECERAGGPMPTEGAPSEPARRERAADVRRQLAEARAAWALGDVVEAHARARRALEAARALDAPGLVARALAIVSVLNRVVRADPDVEGLLREAYRAAEAQRLDELKLGITASLVRQAGCGAYDEKAAVEWAHLGFAAHQRVGAGGAQEANLHWALSEATGCTRPPADAVPHLERAVDLLERQPLPTPSLAMALTELAVMRREEGRRDLLPHLYERARAAFERTVGTSYPGIAALHIQRALMLYDEGEFGPACAELERALELYRNVRQPASAAVLSARNALSQSLVRSGRAAEAAGPQAELLALVGREGAGPGPEGPSVSVTMGIVLIETGRPAEGFDLLRRAIDALRRTPTSGYTVAYLAMGEAWKGEAELRLGRRADAVASFERALALYEEQKDVSPEVPETAFGLARALGATARGRALAERARGAFAALPSEYGRRRAADVERWLAALPARRAPGAPRR